MRLQTIIIFILHIVSHFFITTCLCKSHCLPQYMTFQGKFFFFNSKFDNKQYWKQLLMKCKGIVYRRRVFSLDSTFKLIFTKTFSTWDKMPHLILFVRMNTPRILCWKAYCFYITSTMLCREPYLILLKLYCIVYLNLIFSKPTE